MKNLLNIVITLVCCICFSGCSCNENNYGFNYFKKHVNVIDNYKYYIVRENIYNEELLLYKKEKHVYVDGEKYRILLNTKEIEDLDSEDLYSENEEEYYQKGTSFYYRENNEWKIREVEDNLAIGLSINRDVFSSYKIIEEKGNKILNGKLKRGSIDAFFGFNLNNLDDVNISIVISSKDKLKNISIDYISSEGNNVNVCIDIGYSQIIKFELPVV